MDQSRKLKLNNVSVQYIPDTRAAISVFNENVANAIGAEIKPFDRTRIEAVTADGKEVKDILGFTEVDVILGNQKLESVKMLVFKNSTNPVWFEVTYKRVIKTPSISSKRSWETNKYQRPQQQKDK